MGKTKLYETYIFEIRIKIWFFDVPVGIKIPFFRVSVTIEPGSSLLTVYCHDLFYRGMHSINLVCKEQFAFLVLYIFVFSDALVNFMSAYVEVLLFLFVQRPLFCFWPTLMCKLSYIPFVCLPRFTHNSDIIGL
jgi:hypothetical protein